jgi:hypothetical protein
VSGKLSAHPPAASGGLQRHMNSGGRSGCYVSDLEDEAKKIDEATELNRIRGPPVEIEIDHRHGRKYETRESLHMGVQ